MTDQNAGLRVVIVEDHPLVRSGLRQLFDSEPGIEVVGDTGDGSEAIQIVQEQVPHVVLLDLVLDGSQVTGLDVLKWITTMAPTTQVVVLSAYSEDGLVFPSIRAGAIGYVLKNALPGEVLEAVRDAATGRYHMDAVITKKLVDRLRAEEDPDDRRKLDQLLTAREKEVLPLLAKGMSNQEIADQLHVARPTAKTHVSNILHKLQLKGRESVALWAAQANLSLPRGSDRHGA
jgi:NarL family two-component system response regulator LiaR